MKDSINSYLAAISARDRLSAIRIQRDLRDIRDNIGCITAVVKFFLFLWALPFLVALMIGFAWLLNLLAGH